MGHQASNQFANLVYWWGEPGGGDPPGTVRGVGTPAARACPPEQAGGVFPRSSGTALVPALFPLFNTRLSAHEEEGHFGILSVLASRWSRRPPAPATLGGKQPWLLCGGSPGLVAAARASCASCDLAPYARASLGGQAVGRPAMHKPWLLTTPNANRPRQHSKQS